MSETPTRQQETEALATDLYQQLQAKDNMITDMEQREQLSFEEVHELRKTLRTRTMERDALDVRLLECADQLGNTAQKLAHSQRALQIALQDLEAMTQLDKELSGRVKELEARNLELSARLSEVEDRKPYEPYNSEAHGVWDGHFPVMKHEQRQTGA